MTVPVYKIIIEALERNGYNYEQGIYNSVDFGGDMSRDRFFIRALLHGEVPKVVKTGRTTKGWYNAVNHISARSYDRRTRELARITELVRSARYYAYEDAEHDNFNFFKYYEVFVRLGKETYPLYLNVGRKINPAGEYHLYYITEKIRESAHRLNGVGRVPEGTYALETDSQKNLGWSNLHINQVLNNRISQNSTEVNSQAQKI